MTLPRLDAPGLIHHVFDRGIERRILFHDESDRAFLLAGMERLSHELRFRFLVSAFMPNHTHAVTQTGSVSLSKFRQRLGGCYAKYFNRRYKRVGYVFQGRFGSRVVAPGEDLRRVIRYTLLNPVVAGIVGDLKELESYRWTTFSALMGTREDAFHDLDGVLSLFGSTVHEARLALNRYLSDGLENPEGLRKEFDAIRTAEGGRRIIGPSDFAERVVLEVERRQMEAARAREAGLSLERLVGWACERFQVSEAALRSGEREHRTSHARAMVAYFGSELGMPQQQLTFCLGVGQAGVSRCAKRGKQIALSAGIRLHDLAAEA